MLQNIPAFKFSILLILGVVTGSVFEIPVIILISLQILFLILILILWRKCFNNLLTVFLICLLIFSFGIFKSNLDFFYTEDNSIKSIPATGKNFNVKLRGIIEQIPEDDTSKIRFSISSSNLISGSDTIIISGDVIVNIRKDFFNKEKLSLSELEAGDEVLLTGKLLEPQSKRNPGEFDYKNYLELHNIYKIFNVTGNKNVSVVSKNNLNFFHSAIVFPAKIFALNNINKYSTGDEAAFLKGLVTGERNDISEEMKEDFVNAGVMHLIAVSGLNVAYIIIFLSLILSLLRLDKIARTIIIIIFLIFYCFLTGNSPSIIRASIMGILVLTGFLIERKVNFYNIIGIAVMAILIYDSKQLYDPGFILSFSATISMAVFLNIFQKTFLEKLQRKKVIFTMSALFFTTLAAQIGTLPVTVMYFGKISFISLAANVAAVPAANLSLAIGFFQIIVSIFSEYFSSIIAEANNILLSSQLIFIKWCADLDFAYINIPEINTSEIICFYSIIIFCISFRNKLLFKLVICLLMIAITFLINFDPEKKLKVTFLDVGQGDCSLIQTPEGKTILVDCGRISYSFSSGERTIAPLLRMKGIDKIDLLILTHLHNDHIGGVNYLLDNFETGKILLSGQKIKSSLVQTMDSLIAAKNINIQIIRAGDFIDCLKDVRIYFLFPTNKFVNENGYTMDNNLNNGSIVFVLKYKDTGILFTGDIESEGEKYLSKTYSDFLKTDVLKVAHHGSMTSTILPFLFNNNPQYGIISCGLNNKFNHPSDLILERLEKSRVTVHRTDKDAAAVINSNGYEITFEDWK